MSDINAKIRLEKLVKTLRDVHGVEINFKATPKSLMESHVSFSALKGQLEADSANRNGYRPPEYTKAVLICEAIGIFLREIAPTRKRRKPTAINESVKIKTVFKPKVVTRKVEEMKKETNNLSKLLEDDLESARLIFAASDVTDRLQQMAEQVAKMSVNDIMPIVDDMKGVFGPERSTSFETAANEALDGALAAIKQAKDRLGDEILRLEGKDVPENDMAAGIEPAGEEMGDELGGELDLGGEEELGGEPELGGDEEVEMDDLFGGAEAAASGGEEPLGRAKKESVKSNKKALSEKKGKDLTGDGKIDSDDWKKGRDKAIKKSKSKKTESTKARKALLTRMESLSSKLKEAKTARS